MAKNEKESVPSSEIVTLTNKLTAARAKLVEKMVKDGDVKAGNKAGSIDSDLVSLKRISDRLDKGFYNV